MPSHLFQCTSHAIILCFPSSQVFFTKPTHQHYSASRGIQKSDQLKYTVSFTLLLNEMLYPVSFSFDFKTTLNESALQIESKREFGLEFEGTDM